MLPRQTFLTHCVLHCAVTDSLARGCSWNHGRNTAKCSVVCVYSTRARRAFSCRPGRSVYYSSSALMLLRLTLHSYSIVMLLLWRAPTVRRKCRAGSAERHHGSSSSGRWAQRKEERGGRAAARRPTRIT